MRSKWSRVTTGPTKTCDKDRARAETEQEQSKHDHATEQKWKQRGTALEESKAKEKESDRLRKKRCIQGESSRDRYDKRLLLKLFRQPLCHLHRYTSSPAPIPSTYMQARSKLNLSDPARACAQCAQIAHMLYTCIYAIVYTSVVRTRRTMP